jgi:hypothetical protein
LAFLASGVVCLSFGKGALAGFVSLSPTHLFYTFKELGEKIMGKY